MNHDEEIRRIWKDRKKPAQPVGEIRVEKPRDPGQPGPFVVGMRVLGEVHRDRRPRYWWVFAIILGLAIGAASIWLLGCQYVRHL